MSKKLSRRKFIKLGSACCAAGAFGTFGNRSLSFANSLAGSGKTLVMVNLFGGIDGLSWVVPNSNGVYYDRRPSIAVGPSGLLAINGEIGFNPAWADAYNTVWPDNQMAVVQKVGYPDADRSHFSSQDIWTFGKRSENHSDPRGWLGRLADLYFDQTTDVIGVGVGLKGDFITNRSDTRPTLIDSLEDFTLNRYDWKKPDEVLMDRVRKQIFRQHASVKDLENRVAAASANVYGTTKQFKQVIDNYDSAVTYPEENKLGKNFHEIAKLMQNSVGTQVFYTGLGGWDHHDKLTDQFTPKLTGVAQATAAFVQDLKAMGKWDDVCLVFFSEFGRNCFENGSLGTDHGHANNMILMGGGVSGGAYGQTPTAADLNQNYLPYNIDFRSVFKEVVKNHLGLDPEPIFTEVIPGDKGLGLFT